RKKIFINLLILSESVPKLPVSFTARNGHLLTGSEFLVNGIKRIKSGSELHGFFQELRLAPPGNLHLRTIAHQGKAAFALYIRLHLLQVNKVRIVHPEKVHIPQQLFKLLERARYHEVLFIRKEYPGIVARRLAA